MSATVLYQDELALLEHLEYLFEDSVDEDTLEIVLSEEGEDIRGFLCESMQLDEGLLRRLVDKVMDLFRKMGDKLRQAWDDIKFKMEQRALMKLVKELGDIEAEVSRLEAEMASSVSESIRLDEEERINETIDMLAESIEEAFNPFKMLVRFLNRVVASVKKKVSKLRSRPKPKVITKLSAMVRRLLAALKSWLPLGRNGGFEKPDVSGYRDRMRQSVRSFANDISGGRFGD